MQLANVRAVRHLNDLLSSVNFTLWPSPAQLARYRMLLVLFLQVMLDTTLVRQAGVQHAWYGDVAALSHHELFAFELQLLPAHAANPAQVTPKRLVPHDLDQAIGQRMGREQLCIERWYGVVLVLSEVTHQVCAWRAIKPHGATQLTTA